MPAELTVVIAYDIASDRLRRKVAALLQDELVRVQGSVFEGRITRKDAERLFDAAAALAAPGDRLRLYVIHADGLAACRTHGGVPLPNAGGYWLA